MTFPRYPEYKESGVAWLGDVPAHWGVQQGRRLYWQKRDSALPGDEQLSATQKYGVVPQRLFMEMEDQKVTLALSGLDNFKHVEVDDFVISLRSFQGGIERSKYSGCVSPAYTVLRPAIPVDACYMGYVLKSSGYIASLQSVTDGIRDGKNISYEQFGQIGVPYPTHVEQTAIAAFLDRETAKIDALVAEQEKLIALLKEKRQAVISHAVTKGLDPDVPMKDSGIEWLGEVPAHWFVTPIGHLCEQLSYGFTNPMPTTDDGPYMLTANDVDYGKVKYETARRTSYAAYLNELTEKSRPKRGDVLITKDGTLGRVALHDGQEACINQSVASLRVKVATIYPEFMATCLLGGLYQGRMVYEAGGTTIKHIYISRLAKMPIAYPSLAEQENILEVLAEKLGNFDTLVAESNDAIGLLRERRSALISAAVTGKIDVREVAQAVAAQAA